ncbi:MAG: hypothetical protein ACLVG5_17970 [Clostridium sp.]
MLCALGIMFQHSICNNIFRSSVVDTLFMAAFFMLRAGVMFETSELVEDAEPVVLAYPVSAE